MGGGNGVFCAVFLWVFLRGCGMVKPCEGGKIMVKKARQKVTGPSVMARGTLLTLAGRRVIGIDPGTHCGVAVLDLYGRDSPMFGRQGGDGVSTLIPNREGEPVRVGLGTLAVFEWDLAPRRHEGGGMRPLRFREKLTTLLGGAPNPDAGCLVAFEEVRRHSGVTAAHVYGELKGVAAMCCEEHGHAYQSVPVATVKRHATGGGAASKEQVITAVRGERGPQLGGLLGLGLGDNLLRATVGVELTDNMADAIAILSTVLHDLG